MTIAIIAVAAAAVLAALATGYAWGRSRRPRKDDVRDPVGQGRPQRLEPLTPEKKAERDEWKGRLFNGFHENAIAKGKAMARSDDEPAYFRLSILRNIVAWYEAETAVDPAHRDVDVLIAGDLSLPGGTTESNVQEIKALREAGLTVGLYHHPAYKFDVARPVNPKISHFIESDGGVVAVGRHDSVRARLAILRFPPSFHRLADTLPDVRSDRSVLVVNQSPYGYYGEDGPRRKVWDVAKVRENLRRWPGEVDWYSVGPAITEVMSRHHAEDLGGVELAEEPWYDIVAGDFPPHRGSDRDGVIVVGRHARDDKRKWPSAEDLRLCYPDAPDFRIEVLGGAEAAREKLGGLPDNWNVHGFGEKDVDDFLAGIDVMVYFIGKDAVEAFGRAPMEAMARGIPVVTEPRFADLFGDGALYCEPAAVERTVRDLVSDETRLRRQSESGRRTVRERFSAESYLNRVGRLLPD
ncbi:glycosyltransferase [Salininema proteolyticum]|uniref:Glycosyltransferase n=1 Tax=Salininema proteolyticum TaxID=1607685 RepID=A0ABV8TXB1_9ACTN